MRSAKPFVGIAEFRRPAPEFGGAAVVSKNETIPVTNINGKRQLFEQPPGQFEDLFLSKPRAARAAFATTLKEVLTGLRRKERASSAVLVGLYSVPFRIWLISGSTSDIL
jgi:hypothetical protein